jgi:hypothetical protein
MGSVRGDSPESGHRKNPAAEKQNRDHPPGARKPASKAAAPKTIEFDNDRLLKLLRTATQELGSLRLIHVHLSLLRDHDPGTQAQVRHVINELSGRSSFLQTFAISNGDVITLYKGLKLSVVTGLCQGIERLLLSRTALSGPNPYGDGALYSIMELSVNFIHVLRVLEALMPDQGTATMTVTRPPITLEELARVERAIASVDLSPFLLNQPIVPVGDGAGNDAEYVELYISIKMLEDRLCPNYDLAANPWLFTYLTATLDQSVLRALQHGLSFVRSPRVGININLASVLSSGFTKFDEGLRSDYRGNIVLEIGKSDIVENISLFHDISDYARDKRYDIAIDALSPFWVTHVDLGSLDVRYAKIFWSPDLLEIDGEMKSLFRQRLAGAGPCRFVLARCDSVAGLMFARDAGIDLVQGRAVDAILRKGLSVREAILAARRPLSC